MAENSDLSDPKNTHTFIALRIGLPVSLNTRRKWIKCSLLPFQWILQPHPEVEPYASLEILSLRTEINGSLAKAVFFFFSSPGISLALIYESQR